jgi:histone H3/H4
MPRTSSKIPNAEAKKTRYASIRKPQIRNCCRRAGVKRIESNVYDAVRNMSETFLDKILHDAAIVTQHCGRVKICAKDIQYAARLNGKALYGY